MTPDLPPHGRRIALALAVAVMAISFAAILFKLAPGLDPRVAAGWRLLLAGLLTSPFWLRRRPPLRLLVPAGFAYGLHFGAWVASLGLVSVALSVTAVTTTPLILALVGLATRRDRPTPRTFASLLLGAAGLALMAAHAPLAGSPLIGLGLALLGALAMAAYLLVVARAPQAHPLALSGASAGLGGLLLLAAAAIAGVPLLPSTPTEALVVLGAATLPQLLGHGLMTFAVRHVGPTRVALATLGEPVGAALLAALLLAEPVGPIEALGALLTLAAVALALTRASSPRPADKRRVSG
jgi:drug/metabolite transporter (DMT)-like permease